MDEPLYSKQFLESAEKIILNGAMDVKLNSWMLISDVKERYVKWEDAHKCGVVSLKLIILRKFVYVMDRIYIPYFYPKRLYAFPSFEKELERKYKETTNSSNKRYR